MFRGEPEVGASGMGWLLFSLGGWNVAGGVGVCGGSTETETRRDKERSETGRARRRLPWLIVPSCAGCNIWFPPAGPHPGLLSW